MKREKRWGEGGAEGMIMFLGWGWVSSKKKKIKMFLVHIERERERERQSFIPLNPKIFLFVSKHEM